MKYASASSRILFGENATAFLSNHSKQSQSHNPHRRKQEIAATRSDSIHTSIHDNDIDERFVTTNVDGNNNYLSKRTGSDLLRSKTRNSPDESTLLEAVAPSSFLQYFFGFLMEEESDEDILYRSSIEDSVSVWTHRLNLILCAELALSSAATAVPIALVTALSLHFASHHHSFSMDAALMATRITTAAVLGTSLGKLCNGPVGDVVGARRTLLLYSTGTAVSLLLLATATTPTQVYVACFGVEFSASVQWPCILVLLATHARGQAGGIYEGGVYVTSVGSRLGALLSLGGISFGLLHNGGSWRLGACLGAWSALIATAVTYLYIQDSPRQQHEPQNPVDFLLLKKWFPEYAAGRQPLTCSIALRLLPMIVQHNLLPSTKHVLGSGLFWIVALAHTGATTVRTSERLLGTYLQAAYNNGSNSSPSLSHSRASGLTIVLSAGIVCGLVIAGSWFASQTERPRKHLVSRLYLALIAACYTLAFLAIPTVQFLLASPELVTIFQVMAIFVAGFGLAVPCFHVPSLVGATFGCDKGLYAAYTDGVAYGISYFVWKLVGSQMESPMGWAYGWAAVALLVVIAALLMVEFMEFYFCRPRAGGQYETILLA
jgi:MFS family permease